MSHAPAPAHPLLQLGRLELDPRLRGLTPGPDPADLVVTAAVPVPDTGDGNPQHGFDVAWDDAVRQAAGLGAAAATAQALRRESGDAVRGRGVRVVVAARGAAVLGQWVPPGDPAPAGHQVRVGPLPHLTEAASALAARPAYVIVLADRDGADVIAHDGGREQPADRFGVGDRARPPGADHHDDLPPAQHHGERHVTDSEPISGGQPNAEAIAAVISDAAAKVGAHIVLGVGDEHILAAANGHLAPALGPIITIAGTRDPSGGDEHVRPAAEAALDEITAAAITAVGVLIGSRAQGDSPGAVRGIAAVAEQLAEQQVAVLLLAADLAADPAAGQTYRIGSSPTEFLVGDVDAGVPVPLEDGLVWAALHQDAIVVQLPDRSGALAGEPVAALLRRG
jgi:Bacterial archaeo-eukaryotic release factor family 2